IGSDRRRALEERLQADRETEENNAFKQLVAQRDALLGDDKAPERIKLVEEAPIRNGRFREEFDRFLAEDHEAEERHEFKQVSMELVKHAGDAKATERKKVIQAA